MLTTDNGPTNPFCIGLWLAFGPGNRWQGEGIARTVDFLLRGLAERGLLGSHVRVKVFVTPWLMKDMRESVEELLGERSRSIEFVEIPSLIRQIDRIARLILQARLVGTLPFLLLVRKRKRKAKKAWVLDRSKASFLKLVRYHAQGGYQRPIVDDPPANEAPTPVSREAVLNAIRRIPIIGDRALNAARRFGSSQSWEEAGYAYAAIKRTKKAGVDAWWVVNPVMFGTEFLPKPMVANFHDFFVGEYGFFWDLAAINIVRRRISATLDAAAHVITQSHHNYELQLRPNFGIERDRVSIVYHATPHHYAQYVPTFAKTGVRTRESRLEAEQIIREYLNKKLPKIRSEDFNARGIDVAKLVAFPFASRPYVVISTQHRPYKNVLFAIEAFLKMISKSQSEAVMFITASFNLADQNDEIAKLIKSYVAYDRVFALPRLPSPVHAALYHCASAVVHPSLNEGGVGGYPFFEGMVMGCPGLTARGDYTREGTRIHPDYDSVLFDPGSTNDLIAKLQPLLADSDAAYRRQRPIYEAQARWQWSDAAVEYLRVMLRAADRDDAWLAPFAAADKDVFFDHPAREGSQAAVAELKPIGLDQRGWRPAGRQLEYQTRPHRKN